MLLQTRAMRLISVALALIAATTAGTAAEWRDDAVTRLEALALLQSFNADLLSHPSATLTLENWCAAHHLAPEGKIVAQLDRSMNKVPTDEQRKRLDVGADEPIVYRRVHLSCGTHVLSEADNWYVPARLTPEMNRLLTQTTTPFGRAVLALNFHRELLSARLLWQPLPENWENAVMLPQPGPGALAIPAAVLEHRAVLLTRENIPFSEVVETYTADVLAFPPPAP